MARVQLTETDEALISILQQLRDAAGWTIADEATAIGMRPETLRGVLFAKNRAGPRVLHKLLVYANAVEARVVADTPDVIRSLRECVLSIWQRSLPRLLNRLWQRITDDFESDEALIRFLRVDHADWGHFTRGQDPSASLLRAVSAAYRHEAQRLDRTASEKQRCVDTAEFAELVMQLLSGGDESGVNR